MTLRVLHVLDHSIPLHSAYAFRTPAATMASTPGMAEVALMKQTRSLLLEVAQQVRPHLLQRRPEVRSQAGNV